jgi:tripartite ATP-independent transporter DctM subunit
MPTATGTRGTDMEWIALLLFAAVILLLMAGFPVAFTLAGTGLAFAFAGALGGGFESAFLTGMPSRLFGIMTNDTLVAVPLFVFMGITLERARIAEDLLETLSMLFGRLRGGLGISVTLVGMLLAASTGIVGATVVTMGLLSLPTMLKRGYAPEIATGAICASGTLGQIIPPSIILVMLGDVMSSAYQQAQLAQGNFSPRTVSVGDLFAGALIPGLLLVVLYVVYLFAVALFRPASMPPHAPSAGDKVTVTQFLRALIPPLLLILAVLGSILGGFATPTEAAGVGAMGALAIAAERRALTLERLRSIMRGTMTVSSMVFFILIGASVFSLVFRGYGGDDAVRNMLDALPGGVFTAMLVVMLVMFLLGFVLDFIEITFVVVPIVGPILLAMGVDPVWLGIMIALNLQTSFLTPPFGFALFYLRGVAPPEVTTAQIYRGIMPFVAIQLLALLVLATIPQLATWLPEKLYGR